MTWEPRIPPARDAGRPSGGTLSTRAGNVSAAEPTDRTAPNSFRRTGEVNRLDGTHLICAGTMSATHNGHLSGAKCDRPAAKDSNEGTRTAIRFAVSPFRPQSARGCPTKFQCGFFEQPNTTLLSQDLFPACAMLNHVFSLVENIKIFGPIISSVAIFMMYNFIRLQPTTEHRRSHQPMFIDITVAIRHRMSRQAFHHIPG